MLLQMIDLLRTPQLFLLFIIFLLIPLLFSITFHEFAHGYVAYKFGDITPKAMNRLTLNPFKHLDVLGTIMLLTIGLGWAKPVIINPNNIPDETKRMLVALAGPLANFTLASVFIILMFVLQKYQATFSNHFIIMLFDAVVSINIALAIFNLIPLPPLDGSRIVMWILPENLKILYNKIEPYGIFILMVFVFTVGFGGIFKLASFLQSYIYELLGITL